MTMKIYCIHSVHAIPFFIMHNNFRGPRDEAVLGFPRPSAPLRARQVLRRVQRSSFPQMAHSTFWGVISNHFLFFFYQEHIYRFENHDANSTVKIVCIFLFAKL